MKKKKSCENSTAQSDSVIIKNGFTENQENLDVLSTKTTTTNSSDQMMAPENLIMASDSLKNRDRTSLIADSGSSPVNGDIIEKLTPELLQEKLGTKPKQTNDSSRLELVKHSKSLNFSLLKLSSSMSSKS